MTNFGLFIDNTYLDILTERLPDGHPITNTLTVLTILISLFRYLFTNSFTSDLSDRNTEIVLFPKYNIFIVFTDLGTPSRRLISTFNSNIRSSSAILSISPYLININRLDIFILFTSFFFIALPFFWTMTY